MLRWTGEEDDRLRGAIAACGASMDFSWCKVASIVETRCAKQCRYRVDRLEKIKQRQRERGATPCRRGKTKRQPRFPAVDSEDVFTMMDDGLAIFAAWINAAADTGSACEKDIVVRPRWDPTQHAAPRQVAYSYVFGAPTTSHSFAFRV